MQTQIWLDAIRDEKQSGGRLEGEPLTKGFLALVFKPTPAIKYLLLQSGMGGKLHWESFMWIPCWFCSSDGWEIIMLICLELLDNSSECMFFWSVPIDPKHPVVSVCRVPIRDDFADPPNASGQDRHELFASQCPQTMDLFTSNSLTSFIS